MTEYDAPLENDSIKRYIDLARTLLAKVRAAQNFIKTIDANTKFELPVGIHKTIGGLNYDIVIEKVRMKPSYAELDVFMQFTVPQNGKELTFMARGIKLSNQGGIVGDAKLELLSDNTINFNGDKIQLMIKGSKGGTYVTMDCDGFKEMGLDADVIFSRDLLLPENLNGTVQPEGRVKTSFKLVLGDWNDLLVQLSMPDFQVKGLDGFGFSVRDAVFDFSDLRNSPTVKFPQGYNSPQMLPDNQNLWRGVYIRQLSVRLPREFSKRNESVRTTFDGYDLIIDQLGFSGTVVGRNLIGMNNGDMNGWAYSLDSLGVQMEANQLIEAGFKGGIVIPVADAQKPFRYKAIINTGGNYLFNVQTVTNLSFPLWQAGKVDIYKGSYLEVRIADGRFLPKALLHGKMSIKAKLSDKTEEGKGVELANITFENLQIQAVKPYLKVGSFSFGSEALQQKMAQFPISIDNIGMRSISDTETALDFDLILNLTGSDAGANAFSADAGLSLIAQVEAPNGTQTWKPKRLDVRSIEVDIKGAGYNIAGKIIFYKDDPAYGNGFNGSVTIDLTSLNIVAKASAIFGNVNAERYWYADALVEFSPGLTMFPGIVAKGFGGGAYYRMKMDDQVKSPLGKTSSGVYYIPDSKAGLGIKASLVVATASDKLFTGEVTLEISFFRAGGIRYISLLGKGKMLTTGIDGGIAGKMSAAANKMVQKVKDIEKKIPDGAANLLEKIKDDPAAVDNIHGKIDGTEGISFRAFISYDFENSVLHGNFESYVNVAGGVVQGIGAGGRAGWAVMHFAPGEWYVYVGTPDDRIGLKVGVGPISAQSASYFMVGTKIPGSPPPPEAVSRIMGGANLDYMKDLNAIGDGAGLAFGLSYSISTGDITFLIFYAKFEAGLGFDIMIKNYGETYCSNTGKRLGINGWYANGQAYAYFEGKVGIRVKIFGFRRSVEILAIGAAAILQAQLPNPIWVKGAVGGYYRVLGGLVKGQCKFEVTLGTKCEMVKKADDNALDDIKVISQQTPANLEKEVNVFNTPQVVFNMEVGKNFQVTDNNGLVRTFRIKLDSYKLTYDGGEIVGTQEWNETNDVLAFNSFEVLPPRKDIKATVQVSFEEQVRGSWVTVITDGKKYMEAAEVTFTTGDAPDYIPLENVAYSYPVIGQLNYYKDETREGYIKLKKGQSYLFSPGPEWRQLGRMTAADGSKSEFAFAHASGTIQFSTPSNLKTNQIYNLQLLNVPAKNAAAIDRNVSEKTNQVSVAGQTTETEIKTKQAEGSIEELQEKSIFGTHFKSSAYPTLSNKISNLSFSRGWTWSIQTGVDELGTTSYGPEFFDGFEYVSSAYDQDKLIQVEADLTDNNEWYQQLVYPLVYEGYPLNSRAVIRNRTKETLGLPPIKSVYMRQSPSQRKLTEESVLAGNDLSEKPFAVRIVYNLPLEIYRDYLDLQATVANLSVSESTERINRLLLSQFPVLRQGSYRINLKHLLPGTQKVTSVNPYTINYTIVFVR